MAKKVLTLSELASQLQEVMDFWTRIEVQVLFSADGKDSYDQIVDNKPEMAILGVSMTGISGVELTRRIKENPEFKDVKIVLIADFDNESIKTRAMDAGCDFYLNINEVPQNLYEYVEKVFKTPPRAELRVQTDMEVALAYGNKKIKARAINLSRSGILVAGNETCEIGKELKVGIVGKEGEKIVLNGTVARLLEIPSEGEPQLGMGIRFKDVDAQTLVNLDDLIRYLRGETVITFQGESINLEPVIDLMLMEDAFFAQYLGSLMQSDDSSEDDLNKKGSASVSSTNFNFYFPNLPTWEISAFAGGNEETEVYLSVIRKLVMLFVKFENCTRILDNIPFCESKQEQTLINIIETLMDNGRTAESEIDEILGSEISMSTIGLSTQIAKTRNKYITSKVSLLKGLVERYEQVIDRKPHLEDTVKGFADLLGHLKHEYAEKYKQDISKVSEEKKDAKKESKVKEYKKEDDKKSGKIILLGGVLGFLVIFIGLIYIYSAFIAGRVDTSQFAEPGVIISAKADGRSLTIIADDAWNTSRDKILTRATLERMLPKVHKLGYKKIKFVDSKGKTLGFAQKGPAEKYHVLVY